MDRLNDIMSNSHLPARQSASEKRISPDHRAQQNRSPLTRRLPADQGRRQPQPQAQPSEIDGTEQTGQPYNYQSRSQRRLREQQPGYGHYGQYGQPEDGLSQPEEPITRTDYPTYPTQQPQRSLNHESSATYQARTQPHQDLPHIQPLQPRPTNDYYMPRRDMRDTADDYVTPLHADAVDEESWENGLVYGDFEQGSGDSLLYEEEIEELEDEEVSYQQPQTQAPSLPPMGRPVSSPTHYTGHTRLSATSDHSALDPRQRGQQTPGQDVHQPAQRAMQPEPQLPKNLHDTRLASALARQRAVRKQNYQRVTQPLDPGMTSRAMTPAPQLPNERERQLPGERDRLQRPRNTRILPPSPSHAAPTQPTGMAAKLQSAHSQPAQHIAEEIEVSSSNSETSLARRVEVGSVPAGVPISTKKVCAKCHGAGYLRANVPFGHPNFGKPIACECKEAERKEKRRQQLRTMSNLDAFRERNFDAFQINATIIDAFKASTSFAEDPSGWLVLVGPNGCGKTHLAAAIANQCLDQGAVVLFEAVPDLLDHLRAAFAPTANEVYDQLFSKMREAELLVLDDLGAQQSSPWANEKLFQLLNYRYNMEMPTVVTANHKAMNSMDERIRSRLNDSLLVQYISMDRARDFRPMRGKLPQ